MSLFRLYIPRPRSPPWCQHSLQYSTLPTSSSDLSKGRDVHKYNLKDPTTVLGGLILTNSVINSNFYSMVDIIILFTTGFNLQGEDGTKMERNDEPL